MTTLFLSINALNCAWSLFSGCFLFFYLPVNPVLIRTTCSPGLDVGRSFQAPDRHTNRERDDKHTDFNMNRFASSQKVFFTGSRAEVSLGTRAISYGRAIYEVRRWCWTINPSSQSSPVHPWDARRGWSRVTAAGQLNPAALSPKPRRCESCFVCMLEQKKIYFEVLPPSVEHEMAWIQSLWGIDFVHICLFTKPEKQIFFFKFIYVL